MFGFGFYREDDDDEHKLDRPTHLETILEDNSAAEIPSEESNTLQQTTTSQSDLGLVNGCCYRNCFVQATMKVKKSSSRMSKFCGFHADQQVTEMLVPITDR